MNLYPDAFSKKLQRMISAHDANRLALQGTLEDAADFTCSHNCDVPLICINFKKAPFERTMRPHFRKRKMTLIHHQDCARFRTPHERLSDAFLNDHALNHAALHFDLKKGFDAQTDDVSGNQNGARIQKGSSRDTPTSNLCAIRTIRDFVNLFVRFIVGELKDDFIDPPFTDWVHYLDNSQPLKPHHFGLYFALAKVTLLQYGGFKSAFNIKYTLTHTLEPLPHPRHPVFLLNTFYLKKKNPTMHQFLYDAHISKNIFLVVYLGSFRIVKGKYINPIQGAQSLDRNLALYALDSKRATLLLNYFKQNPLL